MALGTVARFAGAELLLAVGVIALVGSVYRFSRPDAAGSARESIDRAGAADHFVHWLALGLIVVLAVALRWYHLDQPMRYDEANTYLRYATQPLSYGLTDYSYPNNHIFHTVLVWLSTRMLGFEPRVIRLPALAFGILLVPATYLTARVLTDRRAAIVAASLVAAMPWLVLYSTNARGYSLICLIFILLLLLAHDLIRQPSPARWLGFAGLIALGAWTAPVMLYPAGAAALWILVERARVGGRAAAMGTARPLALTATLAGLLTAMLYAPVVMRSGFSSLVANRFVTAEPWGEFFGSLPEFARSLADAMTMGIPGVAAALLLLVALVPLVIPSAYRGMLRSLAVTLALWCLMVLVGTRRAPPARVGLFLAPLTCLYAGAGLACLGGLATRARGRGREAAYAIASLLLAVGIGGNAARRGSIFSSIESIGFPDARDIARSVLDVAGDSDRVVFIPPTAPPLDYYLLTLGGVRLEKLISASRAGPLLVVVDDQVGQTLEKVERLRSNVAWDTYQTPILLKKYPMAELYELRPRPGKTKPGAPPSGAPGSLFRSIDRPAGGQSAEISSSGGGSGLGGGGSNGSSG